MANQVTQLALVTSAIAARLENTLVASRLVNWKKNNKNINPLDGFNYIENVSPRYNRRRWTGEVTDLSGGKQDTVFGSEIFSLNQGDTSDLYWGDFENIQDFDAAKRSDRIRSIGEDLGHLIDAEVLKVASLAGHSHIGTPGNAVDSPEALVEGYARLKEQGVADKEIFAVLPYSDMPALSKYLMELPSTDALSTAMVTSLSFKQIAGLPVLFTQQLPVLKTGTRTNGAVNGASQNVNYRVAGKSTSVNGQFLTQTLAIDGIGSTATVKDGEIFTIEGVYEYDNRKQASTGRLQQFRVIGDYTATGGAIAAMRISPAIIVPDAAGNGVVIGDNGVDTAHATVDSVPADDATITWVGTAETQYLTRALIKKSAVRIETANLEALPSGENSSVSLKSVPLSMRSYKYANGDTGATSVRFDLPWQTNINPFGRYEVVRING